MKLQKFTCAAVLSALVLGAVGPTAFAVEEARSIDGKGTIQYIENDDSSNEGKEVVDPENPDEKLDIDKEEGENNNDKKGTLRVDFVSHLDFGAENKISTGAGEFFATPTKGLNKAKEEVSRGNFIQVTDQRGDGIKGWTLSAEVTKPFTNTAGDVLNGAQITYSNPFVNSDQEDKTNLPTPTSVVVLDTTGDTVSSKVMLSADAAKKQGWGAYTIEYGRPSLDDQQVVVEDGTGVVPATMGESVKLDVPANTPLNIATAYEATIVWTIAELN
ncbi:MAG: WxL domain-containing protein [Vagococcus salmoninarum]|uniref:WxL domain-containing protein n=1 Tax=Vagococcus salmoninarum TaxID=2739 RepID=UPI003F96F079